MNNIVENIAKERDRLLAVLPQKATLEQLEDASDILMTKGLLKLDEILDRDGADEDIKKIKVVNTIVNLGRYIELRKVNIENRNKVKIIIDKKFKINPAKEVAVEDAG